MKQSGSQTEEAVSCPTCGFLQLMPKLRHGTVAKCVRCGFKIRRRNPHSRSRTAALAGAALLLYFPANFLPIVTTYYWGNHEATTIFDGIRGLFQTGGYFVGCLVFTTSILTPALKIIGLLLLSLTLNFRGLEKARTWTYKMIQITDPWNMLEVTLLSILVAIAQLGKVATVQPGAGVFSFAGVVVLTIAATITFDPRLIWDEPKRN